ncbi:uncharacterized protein [Cardiocondyla obscurior]|uniref:uncharacterized protein n=1 Tax=Cardiocondyla obscurior TaxID=286306 RepID=UPI00396563F5
MICIEKQCFNFNKILLLTVGLWPYQRTKLIQFQFIVFLSILTTAILFQVQYRLLFNPKLFLIYVLIKLLLVAHRIYNFRSYCKQKVTELYQMKYLLTQLQQTYNNLKDKYEITIVEKYTYIAKRTTVILARKIHFFYFTSLLLLHMDTYITKAIKKFLLFFTVFGLCNIITLISKFWLSYIFDVSLSRNVSMSRYLIITMEYFIDQEKYFYLIILYPYVAIIIGISTLIATGSMMVAYLQHTCGMFEISSYRIKRVIKLNMPQSVTLRHKNFTEVKEIIYAIDMHRQALKSIKLAYYNFQISKLESSNIDKYFISFLFTATSIIYMFVSNYTGQKVMDHNNHVFLTAYNLQWYLTPLHIQKVILFLLQRGNKNFCLSVGGLFDGSIECFATVRKYYTTH